MAYKDKFKKEEVVKEKKEKKPLTKKQKTLIIVEIIIGVCLLAMVGTFIFIRMKKPAVIDTTVDPNSKYSREAIAASIEENIYPLIEYELYGNYIATDNGGNEEYIFNFRSDNRYFGYSSAEADDFGTYHVLSDGNVYYLNIVCNEADDMYELEFFEGGQISLKNEEHSFLLLEEDKK